MTDALEVPGATAPAERAIVDELVDHTVEVTDVDRPRLLRGFAAASLRRVPPEQLHAADPDRIATELADAFRFADQRAPGELAIRVFTPEIALDGWSDPGTVIEINVEDRPFLLATTREEIERRGLAIVRALHPILGVERDDEGRLEAIVPARGASDRDSFLHLELDSVLDDEDAAALEQGLRSVLHDAIAATDDFPAMREQVEAAADELEAATVAYDADEVEEAQALLRWLLDDNFVLLGWRDYTILGDADAPEEQRAVLAEEGSGLGILRDRSSSRYAQRVPLSELDDDLLARFLGGPLLTISRTNRRSTVHRRTRMDYIGIKRLDEDGQVVGEHRLLGLFTSKGYAEPSAATPVLRRKLDRILEREDVVRGSHDETVLVGLFQALPKDELFQTDLDTLHRHLVALATAEEQRATRVMVRVDRFTRTASVILALPRDRYSPALRERLQGLLAQRFAADRVEVDLSLGDRAEALVRFTAHGIDPDRTLERAGELEGEVRALARSWIDDVRRELTDRYGEADGQRLTRAFVDRLPVAYRDRTPVGRAVLDLTELDALERSGQTMRVRLHPPSEDGLTRFMAYHAHGGIELSSFLPILESLGLTVVEELPHHLADSDLVIHDFGVRAARGTIDVEQDGPNLSRAALAAWRGHLEVDSLNRLILRAGLTWHEVQLLRAYRRFRRQVGTNYTTEYMNDALVDHPSVASALLDHFAAKFDPDRPADAEASARARDEVLAACDTVERLDQDRILRTFLAMVDATVRTNFYVAHRHDAAADGVPYLALKFDSSRVPDVPQPVPYREIFVFSPAVEGVHLRGGPVARGGLRWSDRQDDVRTEIVGLMKAQMLKNAVIVPTGAKGGFVLRRRPSDRAELARVVNQQYVTYIRALLDITDNVVEGEVVAPDRVRRHDGDDPYLVVAADRGTATFSDTANAIADEYGFWLGDAFASGGSRGYDHKALGITARGAWVAVQRHFHELDLDVQHEPIRVVGVGDMSGDVFGNGMLMSRAIRLVAAFDHRDVFLDPDPDAERAFEERQRLFDADGSSWQDYDDEAISAGGGVFSRSRKSIPLSDEVRELLRTDAEQLSPPELIRAVLCAPVDLLWFGGIGTYVKASTETNDEIGDRANDELRVDATDLRARVVGEGANLAITQRARIQYARRGGRINLDAIDNAGGVNTSDHEVNLKILLGLAQERGHLDRGERDVLLDEVTDDVVRHVLRDQELQTWRLSQESDESPGLLEAYEALAQRLETEGVLHRDVEALPTGDEVAQRAEAGAGLTRPELAVLLGYAKRELVAVTLDTPLPDDEALRPALVDYFPDQLAARFGDLLDDHRLRRELVATQLANELVNRLGITFAFRLATETGRDVEDVLAAYWVAREVADAASLWGDVERLGFLLGPSRQLRWKRQVDELVEALVRHELSADGADDLAATVRRDRPVFATLEQELFGLGTPSQRSARTERAQQLVDDLVDEQVATRLACVPELSIAPDVATVQRRLDGQRTVPAVANAFLALSDELALERVRQVLDERALDDRWERWQRAGLEADLRELQRSAAVEALSEGAGHDEHEAVARYLDARRTRLDHAFRLVREIGVEERPRLDSAAVAIRALRDALELRS